MREEHDCGKDTNDSTSDDRERVSLEVTKIHSISGLLPADHGLMTNRTFRAPHHNISLNALIGGGSFAQPGEVSPVPSWSTFFG